MVDQKILDAMKINFENGAAKAQIKDTQLVFEFLKQIVKENEELQGILEGVNMEVGVDVTDKNQSFWLKANGIDITYGEGPAKSPTFIFKTDMAHAAGVIFGDIDPTAAYMNGEVAIQGNLQDALAFNDVIVVAIEAFKNLIGAI